MAGQASASIAAHRPAGGDAGAPVAPDEPAEPGGVLLGRGPVEAERAALGLDLLGGGGGPHQETRGIARRQPEQEEHQGDHAEHDGEAGDARRSEHARHD